MSANYPLPAPPPRVRPQGPGMGRGTKMALWSLGGCGVLVVLLVVGGLIFGGVMFQRTFNMQLGNVRAPNDFPVYPGARAQTSMRMNMKAAGSRGAISLVQWQAPDGSDRVESWYEQHLNQGDWEVTDRIAQRIHFRRRSSGATAVLQVTGQLTHSLVQLEMTGDQPLDAGATPVATDTPGP